MEAERFAYNNIVIAAFLSHLKKYLLHRPELLAYFASFVSYFLPIYVVHHKSDHNYRLSGNTNQKISSKFALASSIFNIFWKMIHETHLFKLIMQMNATN